MTDDGGKGTRSTTVRRVVQLLLMLALATLFIGLGISLASAQGDESRGGEPPIGADAEYYVNAGLDGAPPSLVNPRFGLIVDEGQVRRAAIKSPSPCENAGPRASYAGIFPDTVVESGGRFISRQTNSEGSVLRGEVRDDGFVDTRVRIRYGRGCDNGGPQVRLVEVSKQRWKRYIRKTGFSFQP